MAAKKPRPQTMKSNDVLIHCDGSFDTITLHKNDVIHFKFDNNCDNEEVEIICSVFFPLRKKKRRRPHRDDYTVSLSSS